jgi:KUP system potassium uptake protein
MWAADLPGGGIVPTEAEPASRHPLRIGIMVAALGVVFGDIGTSPLYSLQTVFSLDHGDVRATPTDVYGVISFVFWTITLVATVKYVVLALRADNDGEGGVLALSALVRRSFTECSARTGAIVLAIGVLGASLFYGDSVITPAISVLSAVEGLKVASPGLSHLVLPIAIVILVLLFGVQRWGTGRIGAVFGPVMLLWFLVLAVMGLREIVPHPGVLRGLSPTYAAVFVAEDPKKAFIAMGAIVLVITGVEALYADLGQFGPTPIRRAWFLLVFPALTLNYLAQGALILRTPAARVNPFFLLVPSWAQMPLVILATAATVIASQAVISGAFSVSRQAVRLGFLPHLQFRHTSSRDPGHVYVPVVNGALFVAVLVVVLAFRSSNRLATAYGVAVTATFLITTALLLVLARIRWQWPTGRVVLAGVVFGGLELAFFAANMTKIARGGWLPLIIALALFTAMTTWQRGRRLITARRTAAEGTLADFIDGLSIAGFVRVPGTAIYPHAGFGTAPLALRLNIEHNHVLHEQVVIVTAETTNVPRVPAQERLHVDQLGPARDGVVHVTARFGFQQAPDVCEALRQANSSHLDGAIDIENAVFFVSRIGLRRSTSPGMSGWRKHLFLALARNAPSQADQLCLPADRTVLMGSELDL